MNMKCYPSDMVPFEGLKRDVKVDDLMEIGDFAVARRVDRQLSSKDIKRMADGTCIVPADSSLREETFERIPFLSMTMLRLSYPMEFAKFDLEMKPITDDWKGGMVWPWKQKEKAKQCEESFLMVYKASLLHNQPANYQRRFESREIAEEKQDDYEGLKDALIHNEFTRNSFYQSVGTILLKHSPTMLNYWHYELILENKEGKAIKNVKYKEGEKVEKMNMNASFVNYVWAHFLCKMFWVDENPCYSGIPMSCFYDSQVCCVKRYFASLVNRCLYKVIPIVA